jgi:integrase/recombinase XerD
MDRTLPAFIANEQLTGYADRTIGRRSDTVRLYLEHVAASGGTIDRESVEAFLAPRTAPATRRAYLGDLRRYFRWAVDRGHWEEDPTAGIDTPRVPQRDPSPLSALQVRQVLAVAQGHEENTAIRLGLLAGLRASEAARLEERDVDFELAIIHVRQGKGSKDRRVPLADALRPWLSEGVLRGSTRGAFYDTVKRVYRRAGVEARPHDLRHTFGTELAARCNGNLVLVARVMGHASVNTTMRYVGWQPDGVDAVNGMFAA